MRSANQWVCRVSTVASLAASIAFSADASAETRLGVFGSVGFGGEVDAEGEPDFFAAVESEDKQDLDPTLGVGVSYDAALAKILSAGILLRFFKWEADRYGWETAGDNAGVGLDISFLPRLRFPARKLEIYGALPVGLTLASKEENTIGVDVEYDLGVGYNLGLFGGVQFPIDRDMAVFGELGWQFRSLTTDGNAEANENLDAELRWDTGQFTINAGLAFF